MIDRYISKLKTLPIVKQIVTLVLGTASAQLIGILIYPILTRIYNPNDFGVLELFVSIFSILASIACLKYEQAIITTKTDEDAIFLTKITIGINILFSGLLFVVIFLFFSKIDLLFDSKLGYLLYGVPLMTFITAFFASVRSLAVRLQEYSSITKVNIFRAVIGAISQVTFGFFKMGSLGLISSQFISSYFSNYSFYRRIVKRNDDSTKVLSKSKVKSLLKAHLNFPKFSILATLANSLVIYGTNIGIFSIFDSKVLGHMSLSTKMLSIPLVLIGGALSDVFFQKFSRLQNDGEKLSPSFITLLKTLILCLLPLTILLYFLLPYVYTFVFGNEWSESGVYASILIVLYVVRLINTPFSNVLIVIGKQSIFMWLTFSQLGLLFLLFNAVEVFDLSFIQFLWYYVFSQSAFYILFIGISWTLLKRYEKNA